MPCNPDSTFLNSVMPDKAMLSPHGIDASRVIHVIKLRRKSFVDLHSRLLQHDDLLCSSLR